MLLYYAEMEVGVEIDATILMTRQVRLEARMRQNDITRQTINKVRRVMEERGYRPVTGADLIPNQEAVQIEISTWFEEGRLMGEFGVAPGTTIVTLSDPPVRKITAPGKSTNMVFFRCVKPESSIEMSMPAYEFIQEQFQTRDPQGHTNLARYFVKI